MRIRLGRSFAPILMASVLLTAGVPRIHAAQPELASLRLAIDDLARTFPAQYDRDGAYRNRLAQLETSSATGPEFAQQVAQLRREALLANPLLDFDRLLLVKRDERHLALPQNWESNSTLPRSGIDNAIMVMSNLRGEAKLDLLHQPPAGKFAGDLALHFDAGRFTFSSLGANGRWGVFEMNVAGGAPRQLPLIPDADVDNYTSCYLADDSLIFTSSAPFIGVPCVRGGSHVTHFYRYWPETGKIRRLTFDQEHDWCPTLMPDGRLLYLRWEYSDLPHYVARLLFTMNPDGTNQREFYGSGSYWPNSFFYAKPMPGNPGKVVGIVGGHHGVPRMGELVIIEPSRANFETDGVVQRIPGHGKKVEPVILDNLVDNSWPKFLHPQPLSEKYILVSAKPTPASRWGIYLVDIFDNMTLIKELPGFALLEPVPLQKTPRPPAIPDRVREGEKTALMQITDVYQGPGLKGVPRGTIKKLRLFTYNFSYHNMGGQWDRVGLDGPWDIKRIIGTVPVEPDGSANFQVPANQPISIQPLDENGRAVALMRSWTTAMPGEVQSCVGCHEKKNNPASAGTVLAMRKPPAHIEPFYGPMRGFAFDREVQPVLDRHCISCHNGQPRPDSVSVPDFRRGPLVFAGEKEVQFPPAYVALKAYVRNPTAENDMHMLMPYEFHASTTELVQLLDAGHHGVRLDPESWDRLNTWIDLNTPAWGTWKEMLADDKKTGQPKSANRMGNQRERRRELTQRYAGINDDTEAVYPAPDWQPQPAPPEPPRAATPAPKLDGWPFDTAEARRRQQQAGPAALTLDLGSGVTMTLSRIPAGRFVADGSAAPARVVEIPRSFWMATCEVTNAQYTRFDPTHDSRIEHGDFLQFSVKQRGQPQTDPKQPVCRVSWDDAQSFCRWLSEKTGRRVALPTGDAWEYACRAGAATPMAWGAIDTDFSRLANLADVNLRRPAGYRSGTVPEWRPAITTVNDGFWVSAPVATYAPNPWGLYDMHGNVWEWTTDKAPDGSRRQTRGGSWYVRPHRATADSTLPYHPWQKVYDVGFRVIVEE